MRSLIAGLIGLAFLTIVLAPSTAEAAEPRWVIVGWGDTLTSIAARYQTTTAALIRANNLPSANFLYAGQRLTLPSSSTIPAATNKNSFVYVVRPGDILYDVAARFGTTADTIASANRLYNLNVIYTGQRLLIPGKTSSQPPVQTPGGSPSTTLPPNVVTPPSSGRWIDINIKKQTITAYEGSTPVKSVLVSTGIAVFPTPVGRFAVYKKYTAQLMTGGSRASGTYYYLPNVPYVMYFFKSYAIHGTYWHHNFGHPMSHGCVNLTIADSKWFFDWASNGTPVVSHYN
jgi:lipoprotein-anchoring transpeptidase ErfK/SrfK